MNLVIVDFTTGAIFFDVFFLGVFLTWIGFMILGVLSILEIGVSITGGVESSINTSGICVSGTRRASSSSIDLSIGGGGGSCGGLFVLDVMLLPERCGLWE